MFDEEMIRANSGLMLAAERLLAVVDIRGAGELWPEIEGVREAYKARRAIIYQRIANAKTMVEAGT